VILFFLPNTQTCITDKDCPNGRNYIGRCRKGHCQQRLVRWRVSSKIIADYTLYWNIRGVAIWFLCMHRIIVFFFLLFQILWTLKSWFCTLKYWQRNEIRQCILISYIWRYQHGMNFIYITHFSQLHHLRE
jgi:hypothetical protein